MPLPPISRTWANLIALFGALAFAAGLLLGLLVCLLIVAAKPIAPMPSVEVAWPASKPVLEEHLP